MRRQNNLTSEVIQPRLSAVVLIAIKGTLLYTKYDTSIGSLWKKINNLFDEISDYEHIQWKRRLTDIVFTSKFG